jgi:hypothetical protein
MLQGSLGKCFKSADAERFNLCTISEIDPSAMCGLWNFVGWDNCTEEHRSLSRLEKRGGEASFRDELSRGFSERSCVGVGLVLGSLALNLCTFALISELQGSVL